MIEIPYDPLPHQEQFHRARAPVRLLRGGVGSGKTRAGAAEAIFLALDNPGCDGMIVAPSYLLLQRVTLRSLLTLLPKELLVRHAKSERFLELINGARIYYGSADRPESLEGSNLAWAWADEARYYDYESWVVLQARVRCPRAKRLSIVLTTTPAMGWLYDEFGSPRPDVVEVVASAKDNHHLPPDFVARLERSYDPALYRQYVEGAWVQLEGGVFPEFDEEVHISDPDIYVQNTRVSIAFDPGIQRAASLFFQHLPWCRKHGTQHCVHVLDEMMPSDTATIWLEREWRLRCYERGWEPGVCYLDAAGDSRSTSMGLSDVSVLQDAGWECVWTTDPFKRSIISGIQAIRGKLKPFEGPPSLYFHPRLLDDPSERGVVRSIRESRYPDAKGGEKDDLPIKDGLLDHSRDALRYAIVNLCPLPAVSFVRPVTERKRR